MDIRILLKKLLPGLAPLLVFILADSIWGTEVGLIVAIAFGGIEIVYSLIKGKKPDKFVLFDVGLLVLMGLVSIVLENDVFFKLKPGIIGLLFCAILGISAYGKQNIMMMMAGRYMKGMQFSAWQQYEMLKSIRTIFWLVLGHTLLVFAAALFMSNAVWVAISGPGFYALFGVFFAFEWYRKKQQGAKYGREEWLPIVNETGAVEGKMPRSVAHSGSKILHPVVHLQVFNSRGDLFLQKRAMNKLVAPGKWDTAVGGHVADGESIDLSLQREASEEIGLKQFQAEPFKTYVWETDMERELVFAFTCISDEALSCSPDEVSEGRFWTIEEIEENLNSGIFTENFVHEFPMLMKCISR